MFHRHESVLVAFDSRVRSLHRTADFWVRVQWIVVDRIMAPKAVHLLFWEPVTMFTLLGKRDLKMWLRILRWGIILDDPDKTNVITRVLRRGRQESQSQRDLKTLPTRLVVGATSQEV